MKQTSIEWLQTSSGLVSRNSGVSAQVVSLVAIMLALLSSASHAKTTKWTGESTTNSKWNNDNNWDNSKPAGSTDSLGFDGAAKRLNNTNDYANLTINALSFTVNQSAAVTINATTNTPLTFNAGKVLLVAAGAHKYVGNGSSGSSFYDIKFTGASTNDISIGASFEIQGRIKSNSSSDNFTKIGGGTLILSGNNGGSGGWNFSAGSGFKIQEGVVRLAASNAAGNTANNLIVSSGAALEFSGDSSQTVNNGTWTINGTGIGGYGALRSISGANAISGGPGTIALNSNSSIGVDDGTLTISKVISGASTLTKSGAGTLVLSGANTYTGNTTLNGGVLNLGTVDAIGSSGTVTFTGGTLQFSVSNTSDYSARIKNSTSAVTLDLNGQSVTCASAIDESNTCGLTILGTGTLTLSGANAYTGTTTVTIGTLQLGNGGTSGSLNTDSTISMGAGAIFAVNQSGTVTQGSQFSGAAITGAGGFSQLGSGTTVLNAANSFTGATTVNSGKLVVSGSLSGTATLTLSGGTLQLGDGGASGSINTAPAISIGSRAIFAVNQSGTVTQGTHFSGAITGAGGFSQLGGGTTVLNAANSFTGTTTVNSGKLVVSGSLSGTATLTLSGGTLQLGDGGASGSINTAAAISIGSGAVFAVNQSGTVTQGTQFSGAAITGAGGISQLGSGTTELTAANSYTGPTTISAGTLSVATLANGGSNSGIGASGNSAANLVLNGGVLRYTGGAVSTDRAFTLGISGGTIEASGSGALTLAGTTAPTLSGTDTARTLALGGTSTADNVLAAAVGDNGSGATSLTKSGAGKWVLTGNNSYTGNTTINASGGTLQLGAGGASGALAAASAISLGSGATLVFNRSDTITQGTHFSTAAITGAGGISQAGSGTTELTAANSYTGPTTISAGTLSVATLANGGSNSGIGASGNSAANLVLNGGVLRYTGGAVSTDRAFTLGTSGGTIEASGSGALTLAGTTAPTLSGTDTARTLMLGGTSTADNVLAAAVGDNGSGATSLTKSGVGKWVLTGNNTYTGNTTINAGTLALGANDVFANNTAVSIGSATLDAATFTDTLGTLDVSAGATIHLGAGGALAFANSSGVDWTGGTLAITGTFVPGSSLRFGTSSGGLTAGQLTLITAFGWEYFNLDNNGYLTASRAVHGTVYKIR